MKEANRKWRSIPEMVDYLNEEIIPHIKKKDEKIERLEIEVAATRRKINVLENEIRGYEGQQAPKDRLPSIDLSQLVARHGGSQY